MLYYDKIDISKEVDLAKSNNSNKCMICHYWFFNHGFKFQHSSCNGCHHSTNLSVNISDIAVITVTDADYGCIIHNISRYEAISLSKKFCSPKLWIYIKNIIPSFRLFKAVFFTFFV